MTSKNMQLSTIDSRGQFAETAFGKHKRRAGVIRPPYRVTFVDRFVRIRNVLKRSGVSHFSQQTRERGTLRVMSSGRWCPRDVADRYDLYGRTTPCPASPSRRAAHTYI